MLKLKFITNPDQFGMEEYDELVGEIRIKKATSCSNNCNHNLWEVYRHIEGSGSIAQNLLNEENFVYIKHNHHKESWENLIIKALEKLLKEEK